MAQFELVLKDDIAKLIPAMLAWNNKEIMAQVNEILPRYMSVEYGDDIDQAKADRTTLNNLTKRMNEWRLEIKKEYTAPLDKFTAEVNEVIEAVSKATERIGEIIAAHDNKIKSEKKAEIVKYYKSVIGDLADLVPYEKIEDTKWYNATSKYKKVYAEIDKIIAKIHEDLTVINSLGADDTEGLKLFYFRTLNLVDALNENERIKQEKAKIGALSEANSVDKQTDSDEKDEVFTIRFEVKGTQKELAKLAKFLRDNGIEYSKIDD
mgnify:CR=1 FL=1